MKHPLQPSAGMRPCVFNLTVDSAADVSRETSAAEIVLTANEGDGARQPGDARTSTASR